MPPGYNAIMVTSLPELSFNGVAAARLDFPATDAQSIEVTCPVVPDAVSASLTIGAEELGSPTMRLGADTWRWEWQPRGRAGAFSVRLTVRCAAGSLRVRDCVLSVATGKLDGAGLEEMLSAIQRAAVALVFSIQGGRWGADLAASIEGPRALLEDYWRRVEHEARLATGVTRSLSRQPRVGTRLKVEERRLDEIAEVRLDDLARAPERPLDRPARSLSPSLARLLPAGRAGQLLLPRSLPVRSAETTGAIYEHRLLARVLLDLESRCHYIREELRREIRWRESSGAPGTDSSSLALLMEWDTGTAGTLRSLQRARSADFLRDVEPLAQWRGPTELMRRDRRYRTVARLWRLVSERPFAALQSPAFEMPGRDLPALYELWCLLEVARSLEQVGRLVDQNLIVADYGRSAAIPRAIWKIRPAEDTPIVRRVRPDGTRVELYYQRRCRPAAGYGPQLGSLDPFLHIPDVVVEVSPPGRPAEVLVFDAKYRVAPSGGIPEDALADAYTYRAAIGREGVPVVTGAYLLFPGRQGFDAGGVGALPLLPGKTAALTALVQKKIGLL